MVEHFGALADLDAELRLWSSQPGTLLDVFVDFRTPREHIPKNGSTLDKIVGRRLERLA